MKYPIVSDSQSQALARTRLNKAVVALGEEVGHEAHVVSIAQGIELPHPAAPAAELAEKTEFDARVLGQMPVNRLKDQVVDRPFRAIAYGLFPTLSEQERLP